MKNYFKCIFGAVLCIPLLTGCATVDRLLDPYGPPIYVVPAPPPPPHRHYHPVPPPRHRPAPPPPSRRHRCSVDKAYETQYCVPAEKKLC